VSVRERLQLIAAGAAMLGAVCATPYVIAWGYLIWSST
jgi:hypothetical protein